MFDRQETIFVSVTQQFNTATSLGRLTLHILLSFGQFEREIIGERTRDKMSAARRKGKWTGGYPVLGYEVAAGGGSLVVHESEARQVRAMFARYAELSSLSRMVEECERQGWKTKEWKSRRGGTHRARRYTEASLARLLGNVTYKGAVRHQGEVLAGEQEEIVSVELFDRVGGLLGVTRGKPVKVKAMPRPLLEGLLRCGPCESAMGRSYCTKQGRRYGYYVCGRAQAKGWRASRRPGWAWGWCCGRCWRMSRGSSDTSCTGSA